MKIHIEWSKPFFLKDGSKEGLIYAVDENKLPDAAGIYIFGRKFKSHFEALYVGQAGKLSGRVRGQLNNARLMMHLKNAGSGKRVLIVGRFASKSALKIEKSLDIVESTLIRHFLSEGHDLVNVKGTRLRQHEIISEGKHPKKLMPKVMFVDKTKR